MDDVIRENLGSAHPLARALDEFLTDLANGNASAHTIRAYRGDLLGFAGHHDAGPGELTAAPVRAYLAETAGLAPATRKAQAGRGRLVLPVGGAPRAARRQPDGPHRHRQGPQAAAPPGRGRRRREGPGLLLDDRGYVALLKLYLQRTGYQAGPLFRASVNGSGGPLSYAAAQHRWTRYCAAAGADIDIHQLRHAHATELINAGVSIEAVRRRLGHASTETTQLYALLDDKVADDEIRAAPAAPGPRARRQRPGRTPAIKIPYLAARRSFGSPGPGRLRAAPQHAETRVRPGRRIDTMPG